MDLGEELLGGDFFGEEVMVGVDGGDGSVVGFIEELDAVVAQAGGEELLEEAGTGLGATVEEGVAAANIGLEAVKLADAVFQMNDVLFARATAVFVGGAGAEEGAEHAMLHMKHWHVLMEGEFQPVGGRFF